MRSIITAFLLFVCFAAAAQNYNVAAIPDSLIVGANAVKRMEELHVVIKALDKVIVRHHYAITILNEKGDEYAEYSNNYSSMHDLSDISGNLYDASGKKIRSVKKKDIADVANSDGMSLALDSRIKTHNFYHRQYPYTVEYEDEELVRGTYFLSSWHPVEDDNFAVEQSRYIVEIPADYNLRVKQVNFNGAPVVVKTPTMVSQAWELKNYKGVSYESFSPSLSTIVPSVSIGASDFSFGGYTGNMNTWLDFGKFNVTLNKGRDVLPDNIKKEVHALVDGIEDKEEKVKKLYAYLQKNTRYIGVQLGIGGWQPFDAKYVATYKYGDCKALSNFMVSLLKEAGIKANYVLISAGKNYRRLQDDFPISNFNHIITCVPNGKDSIWLECTDQTKSAGFMGTFTGGRKAVLIDDDGGHVVTTPFYGAEDNLQLRTINAVIDAAGNLDVDMNTRFTGTKQELQHALIHDASPEQREKYLNAAISLPTYKVSRSEYNEMKGRLPMIDEHLHIVSPNYATVSGRRLFVEPNLLNKSKLKLPADGQRKYPIEFNSAYKEVDSVHLLLPEGYGVEAMPKDVDIANSFGHYSISYKVSGNKVDVIRSHTIKNATLAAETYPDLVKYYDIIYKADHSRIVFVKKEG
jgi:transglutaminase-like putative cysteine protease